MEIIKEKKVISEVSFSLDFLWNDSLELAFSFPCDEWENPLIDKEMADNYDKCVSGEYKVILKGRSTNRLRYTAPAVARCDCGSTFSLMENYNNACHDCGKPFELEA